MWNRKKYLKRKKKVHGFTLIELMAVVVILGMLVGITTVAIMPRIRKASINTAATQISQLEQTIQTFRLDCGFYPAALEDLVNAPSGRTCKGYPPEGYLSRKEIPLDPWKQPYNYATPGLHNTTGYDLWSNGPDEQEGTSDDITNWKAEGNAQGESGS